MSVPAVVEKYWVVMLWGERMFAGPGGPGGPPWLFLQESHAALYRDQLQGMEAIVRTFTPSVLEWQGKTLVQVPAIPPPDFYADDDGAQHTNASESSDSESHANGTPNHGTPLAPPPDLEPT